MRKHARLADAVNGGQPQVGALVGPPWSKRQLGLVFREQAQPQSDASTKELFKGASLYFEPHCDFDESSVARVGQVRGWPVCTCCTVCMCAHGVFLLGRVM